MSLTTQSIPSRSKAIGEWSQSVEYTAQQTDAVVQAAPGAGLRLVVKYVTIICNAAVTVTLEQGTATLLFKHYGDAQGSGVALAEMRQELDENTNLTITTSGAITVFLKVGGTIDRI